MSQESNCCSLSFTKLLSLQACNFINKRLLHKYFLVKFAKFLRTHILKSGDWKTAQKQIPPGFGLRFGLGSGAIFREAIFQAAIFLVPLRTSANDCFCVLITSSYIDFYNSLKYTFFVFSSNFFCITQLKQQN